jgi:predicted RNA binding protein YcfA (HicA-like mRNA interferase family)
VTHLECQGESRRTLPKRGKAPHVVPRGAIIGDLCRPRQDAVAGEERAALWDNRTDVKIRDVVKLLEEDGWVVVRQRGSHRQFKHGRKPGLVTVAGKPGDDLAPGTLNSILKQAGLKP